MIKMDSEKEIQTWYLATTNEMHCKQVTRFINEKYDEPLLYVEFYKYCQLEVYTKNNTQPKLNFQLVDFDSDNKLGINVFKYDSENITDMHVFALPSYEYSKILSFPKNMDEAEKNRIREKCNDPKSYGLDIENWEEDGDLDLWIWGELELLDVDGNFVSILKSET
jgi:hypothetical protein